MVHSSDDHVSQIANTCSCTDTSPKPYMDPLFFWLKALDLPIHRNSLEKDCVEKSTAFQNHIAKLFLILLAFIYKLMHTRGKLFTPKVYKKIVLPSHQTPRSTFQRQPLLAFFAHSKLGLLKRKQGNYNQPQQQSITNYALSTC